MGTRDSAVTDASRRLRGAFTRCRKVITRQISVRFAERGEWIQEGGEDVSMQLGGVLLVW